MNTAKRFLNKWKAEYDFKTYISAAGSLAVTLIFAFYNGFLGIYHASLWHGTICVYGLQSCFCRYTRLLKGSSESKTIEKAGSKVIRIRDTGNNRSIGIDHKL